MVGALGVDRDEQVLVRGGEVGQCKEELVASLAALEDGNVFLYSDALHTFTTSRRDFGSLLGAYAVSNNGLYVAGNNLLNSSLVPVKALDSGVNPSSGFVFVNNAAFRSTAPGGKVPPPLATLLLERRLRRSA